MGRYWRIKMIQQRDFVRSSIITCGSHPTHPPTTFIPARISRNRRDIPHHHHHHPRPTGGPATAQSDCPQWKGDLGENVAQYDSLVIIYEIRSILDLVTCITTHSKRVLISQQQSLVSRLCPPTVIESWTMEVPSLMNNNPKATGGNKITLNIYFGWTHLASIFAP